jgi:two-component system NarL family sensor kinase
VRVRREPHHVVLEVSDDGRGLDAGAADAAVAEGHIGLASAAERVRALDGFLTIASEPGRGTRVRVGLPE